MSGTPKYSQARLDVQRQEDLRRNMERRAAEERRKREEAARKERERIARATKQANQDLIELQALVAGTKADNLVSYWCQTEIQSLESKITQAEMSLKQQDFSHIKTLLQQAQAQQKAMQTKAQEKQQHKEEQKIYVETLQDVLDEMGYYTQKAPTATSTAPDAQITFTTESSLGEEIEVTIGLEGQVEYVAEGFGDRQEESFDGKQIKSCPKTVPTLLKIHQKAQEKGVILTPPTWLDQDPNRDLRDADSLPNLSSTPKERTSNV